MKSPRKLSSNEVAALVGGLMDMDGGGDENGVSYRSYQFGSDDLSLLGEFHALTDKRHDIAKPRNAAVIIAQFVQDFLKIDVVAGGHCWGLLQNPSGGRARKGPSNRGLSHESVNGP